MRGYRVITDLLKEFDSEEFKGLVVFLPMVHGDDAASADERAREFEDARLASLWDQERSVGRLFKQTLGLNSTAWDVYLLYEPGVVWEGERPPPPISWMHQLSRVTGAPRDRGLEPERLAAEVRRALERLPAGHRPPPPW